MSTGAMLLVSLLLDSWGRWKRPGKLCERLGKFCKRPGMLCERPGANSRCEDSATRDSVLVWVLSRPDGDGEPSLLMPQPNFGNTLATFGQAGQGRF